VTLAPIALSRTCALAEDFADCLTVAEWQQLLADEAWNRWVDTYHVRTRDHALCVNWSGCPFVAPGTEAEYRYRGEDPHANNGDGRALPKQGLPAIYGLSVLDHSDAPVRFLTRASQVLRPHGLLFLTFALWNAEGDDWASGYADRTRIYDVRSWKKLVVEARRLGFTPFGGMNWTYHGNKLDDHSLASLVLTWRER
jgi:hypothetical protein